MKLIYFTVYLLLAQSTFAWGATKTPLFEGYYKVLLGGRHAGYIVHRYTLDDSKKQISTAYYVFVKTPSTSTTESLVAVSDLNFEPISYQYSAVVDGKAIANDGSFKNKKLSAKMIDGKKTQNVTLSVPPNGFLAIFLNYVILKNGLGVGKSYEFNALAEESPACFKGDPLCKANEAGFIKGTAAIRSEQKYKNLDTYKVEFKFKGRSFSGLLTSTGETLATNSPAQDIMTELVGTKGEAVGAFTFNTKHIMALFGDIPEGKANAVATPPPVTKSLPAATSDKKDE